MKNHFIYLFFLTKTQIQRGGNMKYSKSKIMVQCREAETSIYRGNSKMFALPYWKCHQYDNIILNKDILIDCYPLSMLICQRRIENYILQKTTMYNDRLNYNIPKNIILKNIYKYTEKYKIYDIDWSERMDNKCSKEIISILQSVPSIERTFEKKYYDIEKFDKNTLNQKEEGNNTNIDELPLIIESQQSSTAVELTEELFDDIANLSSDDYDFFLVKLMMKMLISLWMICWII